MTERLSVLSHPQRMAVFRLLMRRYPDRVPAGEITTALSLKPSTASVYLSALNRSGLISQSRAGTSLLYAVDLEASRQVMAGLFEEGCQARADLWPAGSGAPAGMKPSGDGGRFNVLFVCTGNSARSIMAQSILHQIAGDRFHAFSAGTAPRDRINGVVAGILERRGIEVSGLTPKSIAGFWQESGPIMDFRFTVCDNAANCDVGTLPGNPVAGHWGVSGPGSQGLSDHDRRAAFEQIWTTLHHRISAFAALPLDTLDRATVQTHIDAIAGLAAGKGYTQ